MGLSLNLATRLSCLCLLALTLLSPAPSRAEFLKLVGWKAAGKGRLNVLVWRQQLDLQRGFDSYFFDEYEAPANKRLKSSAVALRARDRWLPVGQFEVYLLEVREAAKRLLKTCQKAGYQMVCDVASVPNGKSAQISFRAGEAELTLSLVRGPKRDEVVLQKGENKSYSLVRILPPGGRDAPTVGSRTLVQGALLHGGRMLAVIVHTQLLPAPENCPAESVYFFPLRRATKSLGLPYPLTVENCVEKEDPWP